MINDFNDFCTWMYIVVDDIWLTIAPFFKLPGQPPECPDSELLAMALIGERRGWDLEGDKAYISAEKAAHLWQHTPIQLNTIPRQNQHKQLPHRLRRLYNSICQMIETVNVQLSSQFQIEVNHAYSFWGLCTRLYTKLIADALCIYLIRLIGKPAFLQIKAWLFRFSVSPYLGCYTSSARSWRLGWLIGCKDRISHSSI